MPGKENNHKQKGATIILSIATVFSSIILVARILYLRIVTVNTEHLMSQKSILPLPPTACLLFSRSIVG